MTRVVVGSVAAMIGLALAATLAASMRWDRQTTALIASLGAGNAAPSTYREAILADLPPPAQRYFRASLRPDQPMMRSAVATQQAEFYINDAWRPLTATQHFRISPPAFVWDARIAMAPMMPVSVRDSYVDGHGAMKASMLGLIGLADVAERPELNLGARQRFLGEAVWLPTALLPSPTVRWSPRDDHSAVATLSDNGRDVSLVFEFDETGMVRTISGDRYKEAAGAFTLQRWLITCGEATDHDGLRIPARCEVAWIVDGKPVPYWRGRLETIRYEFRQ
ncbi:MAG: DUF6544 family protein [Acidimicrobiia bacterium]